MASSTRPLCARPDRAVVYLLKLIARNSLRHKLRTALTTLGIVIAVLAFGLLQTVVDAWYAGADSASSPVRDPRVAISPR